MIKRNLLKIFGALLFGFLVLLASAKYSLANADTLVINEDGSVNLIVGTNITSLGESVQNTLAAEVQAKEVNLVPANVKSEVKIEPSKKDNKKVQVTVTPKPAPTNKPSAPQPAPIVKEVDNVVATGKSGQVVLSVNPAGSGQVSLNQGQTQAATSLPVAVDSQSHSVSVVSPEGQKNVTVLPEDAVDQVVSKGLMSQEATSAKPATQIQVDKNQAVYQIAGDKQLNLLNVVKFNVPVKVEMSAQTGRVLNFTINIRKLFGF